MVSRIDIRDVLTESAKRDRDSGLSLPVTRESAATRTHEGRENRSPASSELLFTDKLREEVLEKTK